MDYQSQARPLRRPAIVIAEEDARRISVLLGSGPSGRARDAAHLQELRSELERAVIVATGEIPSGVVTMHGVVGVRDLASGGLSEVTLVFPHEADAGRGLISVLAPLGTALLGYREGDEVEWLMPGGLRRLRIENVRSRNEHPVRH